MLDKAHFRTKHNADFNYSIPYNIDLSGSTFKMEIRDKISGDILASLTTANDGIACDFLPHSTVTFFLAKDDMPDAGTYEYDLLRISGEFEDFMLGGDFIVYRGVTA